MLAFIADVRHALRGLLKRPGFTLVITLTLALGIGANTAIYSLYDQVVLRRLPVAAAEDLVALSSAGPRWGMTSNSGIGPREQIFSYPMLRDLQAQQSVFTGIAGHRDLGINLAVEGRTQAGRALMVSGNYFPVLGLVPAAGRLIAEDDDTAVGKGRVAVLNHRYWVSQLGGAPDIIGKPVKVNGETLTVIGVAPEGFDSTSFGVRPLVYVPLTMRWALTSGIDDDSGNRRSWWIYLFARIKPGVTLEQASAELAALHARIINEVEVPLNADMDQTTLAQFKAAPIRLLPGARGQSSVSARSATPMLLLMAVASLVLLVACLNCANLLLARASTRSAEVALRASIGASRVQLLRQHLAEALLLALLGGLAGLPVAAVCLQSVVSLMPGDTVQAISMQLDPVAMRYGLLVALGTVLVFGLYPALHAARTDPIHSLRAGAGAGGGRIALRFRNVLATAQIALSMVSLVVAGLFLVSLDNLSRVDLGLRAESIATFELSPARNGYDNARSQRLYDEVERGLASLPGVASVTTSLVPLLSGDNWTSNVSVEGHGAQDPGEDGTQYNAVGPGYFTTLQQPLLAGREFVDADAAGRPKVAIVNRAFAERFGLWPDAVGKRMAFGGSEDLDMEIVGVAADARYDSVRDAPAPQFYMARKQFGSAGSMVFYVRAQMAPERLLQLVPGVVAQVDPDLPVERLMTLPQSIRENLVLDVFVGTLSGAFAVLATLLAALGVYGVLNYALSQRTREIGLKLALGAAPGRVQASLLGQAGRMFLIGGGIGLVLALMLGRAAQALLFQLEGHDLRVLLGASAILAAIALLAAWWPARRAARVDPLVALRWE